MPHYAPSRRTLLKATGWGLTALAASPVFGGPRLALTASNASVFDSGTVKNGAVMLPSEKGRADPSDAPPPRLPGWNARLGVAVVGLGRLALEEILPAFAESHQARVTALVSGSREKAALVAQQYNVPSASLYNYANFDGIADNPDVQAVYIVLPNGLHREFTERAARAGKHVLCEKPMATTVADAEAMIQACRIAGRTLMIAYRCQYEPYNRELARLAQSGELGAIRFIEATNTQIQGAPEQWRLKKALSGGGALPDIGLYCLNAARFVTGEEPMQAFAQMLQPKDDPRFREVEERMMFMLRFPSGAMAQCATSYDAFDTKTLAVRCEKGWATLDGAYSYHGKKLEIGRKMLDALSIASPHLSEKNQFALELDHLAACIQEKQRPRTPGEEGLRDQRLMAALYRSAAAGAPVAL